MDTIKPSAYNSGYVHQYGYFWQGAPFVDRGEYCESPAAAYREALAAAGNASRQTWFRIKIMEWLQ